MIVLSVRVTVVPDLSIILNWKVITGHEIHKNI